MMKHLFLLMVLSLSCMVTVFGQQPTSSQAGNSGQGARAPQLPAAFPMLSPALCGKSSYTVSLGSQPIGREDFEINCTGNGFAGSGHTKLDVAGQSVDLTTDIQVDKSGLPLRFATKGSITGQQIDQVATIEKDTITVSSNGQTASPAPYRGGAMFNQYANYVYQFMLARYDAAKGGPQEVPVVGIGRVGLERVGRDEVQPAGAGSAPSAGFDRYLLKIGAAQAYMWVDRNGRIALISVPVQNYNAVREDSVAFAPSLQAALAAASKGTLDDYSEPPTAPYTAEEITIKIGAFVLAGTLLLPKGAHGKVPAVVMSTGSGQQRRDEQLSMPGLESYHPFRQIAEALASRGIAVLR